MDLIFLFDVLQEKDQCENLKKKTFYFKMGLRITTSPSVNPESIST